MTFNTIQPEREREHVMQLANDCTACTDNGSIRSVSRDIYEPITSHYSNAIISGRERKAAISNTEHLA